MINLTDFLAELPGPRRSPERQIGDNILPLSDKLKPKLIDPSPELPPFIQRRTVCPGVTYFAVEIGKWCLFGGFEPNRHETDVLLAEIGIDVQKPGSVIYDEAVYCSASGCPEELPAELGKLSDFDRALLEAALETAIKYI